MFFSRNHVKTASLYFTQAGNLKKYMLHFSFYDCLHVTVHHKPPLYDSNLC